MHEKRHEVERQLTSGSIIVTTSCTKVIEILRTDLLLGDSKTAQLHFVDAQITRVRRLIGVAGRSGKAVVRISSLGQVDIVLASHMILHDVLVLEVHAADVTLGGVGGVLVLIADVAAKAARMNVPPAHLALHLPLHTGG